MRQLMAFERRLLDLERRTENQTRTGEIVDVKFDAEKKRWYVKMNDGKDLTPSGGQAAEGGDAEETYKSDWLPWKSFSHGTIRTSFPPRKGMKVAQTSPNGDSELAYAEPYHYDPKYPSPHDKEDEVFFSIEEPDQENQNGEGGQQQQQQQTEKKKITFKGDNQSYEIKSGKMTTIVSATKISGTIGDTSLTITEGKIELKIGGANLTLTADALAALFPDYDWKS